MTDFSQIVQSAIDVASRRIARMERRLLADEPALGSSPDFGPKVKQGVAQGPSLIIADHSATDLFSLERVGLYEHRMALLAKPGDAVVVRRRIPEFERYLAEFLGLRDISFIECGDDNTAPLAKNLRHDPELVERLPAAWTTGASLTVLPYMTSGHVWRLAHRLGEVRRGVVHVAGATPRATKRANDKLWFWQLARELTGTDSVPPTMYAFGPAAAAAKVAHLAMQAASVVVKVPSSAGGHGNLRLESAALRGMPLSDIRTLIVDRLVSAGWNHVYPVLVGVWETGVTASPSAQVWIPLRQDGPPRILGLFEQRVAGEAGAFSGARPAEIDERLAREMVVEAAQIAAVLQRIGYFGPCSLDAVIRSAPGGRPELHWVECNGRWSGVSIPLASAAGLAGKSRPEGLVVLQEILPECRPLDTSRLCALMDDLMFRSGVSGEGIVILSPPDRAGGLSLNVMALAGSQARAAAMVRTLHQRIGTGPA